MPGRLPFAWLFARTAPQSKNSAAKQEQRRKASSAPRGKNAAAAALVVGKQMISEGISTTRADGWRWADHNIE